MENRDGGPAATLRPGILSTNMPVKMRPVLPLPADPRGNPARPELHSGVLPGGLAV
ncbi:hypothetical protein KSP40_PGU007650 [Platanthera guangdongensis]|uniref:Uncharacterized protein n=1 Tax=Platanthera guangdongensis TaxID=2320717 RepID=A0ABR2LE32_9ASPA